MQPSRRQIIVWMGDQRMEVLDGDGRVVAEFPVSTSAWGAGFTPGSMKTPTGRFRVAEKIGAGEKCGMVFKSRVPTGEIACPEMEGDVISSRILWLEGLGKRNANTKSRYIYIHGTNREDLLGKTASHGCVRMGNTDVVELFDLVDVGCEVRIATGSRHAKS